MSALGLLTHYGLTRVAGGGPGPGPAERILQALGGTQSPNTEASQVGYTLTPNTDLTLTALRLYLGSNSNGEVIRVWRVSDTTLLGTVTVNALEDTWVEEELTTPINLDQGVSYVIATRSGNPRRWYSAARTAQAWSALITPGAGRLGAGTGFPTTTNSSNVWGFVDGLIAPR